MHHGFGERHDGFRRGGFIGGLGFGYYGYPYGWDYSPDYGYSGYSQPYSSQNWYYCSDPAGYYPYVAQCNTGWQAVPASYFPAQKPFSDDRATSLGARTRRQVAADKL
jgi:hypothetical protein